MAKKPVKRALLTIRVGDGFYEALEPLCGPDESVSALVRRVLGASVESPGIEDDLETLLLLIVKQVQSGALGLSPAEGRALNRVNEFTKALRGRRSMPVSEQGGT